MDESAVSNTSYNWKIKIDNTNLKKVNFHFDNQNSEPEKSGMDYRHFDIENFNLQATNLNYNSGKASGTVHSLSIKQQKGLDIQSLKTDFVYTDKGVSLKNLFYMLKFQNFCLKQKRN